MFDIGFSELVLIAIVGLVVFGPEELPRVARTAGHLLGRLRRYVADVKSDISREMEASEMKSLVSDVQESARAFQSSINEQAAAFKAEFSEVASLPEQAKATLEASFAAETSTDTAATASPEAVQDSIGVASGIPEVTPPVETAACVPEVQAAPAPEPTRDENQLDLFGEPPTVRKEQKE
ncbi:Sec-independent protein translocase protein TatB [Uliginosibacterium paludis]|uniref:Sec-independent protein translocase protein TatB n=1 Tax=Uliginosibacterium paludis TaxID=1615952 RepID=A0ABV2CQ23_9RHOO